MWNFNNAKNYQWRDTKGNESKNTIIMENAPNFLRYVIKTPINLKIQAGGEPFIAVQ